MLTLGDCGNSGREQSPLDVKCELFHAHRQRCRHDLNGLDWRDHNRYRDSKCHCSYESCMRILRAKKLVDSTHNSFVLCVRKWRSKVRLY